MTPKMKFKLAYGATRRSYKTATGLTVVCPGGTPAVVRTMFRATGCVWTACHYALVAKAAAAKRFTAPTPHGVAYIPALPA